MFDNILDPLNRTILDLTNLLYEWFLLSQNSSVFLQSPGKIDGCVWSLRNLWKRILCSGWSRS